MSNDIDSTPTVILLVDVDCFEVQVWQKKYPATIGKPCLTANEAGMITSVNYEAKRKGVTRKRMNLQEARRICPDLEVIQIPNRYGKPETRTPRLESYKIADKVKELFDSYSEKSIVRYQSKDEFFIDVSNEVARRIKLNNNDATNKDLKDLPDRTFLLHHRCRIQKIQKSFDYRILQVLSKSSRKDHRDELGLVHGSIIANHLLKFLKRETGYECSAGVGHTMLTTKLSCGLNKPAAITMMPLNAIERSSKKIFIPDIPGLGGHKGRVIMKNFNIKTMHELSLVPKRKLENVGELGEEAFRFHYLSLGNDSTKVSEKDVSKDISCGKSFKGRRRIESQGGIFEHLYLLCAEMMERLIEEVDRNGRTPISFKLEIKACHTNGRRDSNLETIFGESISVAKDVTLTTDDLFGKFKHLITKKNTVHDSDTPNIVSLNIISKFSDM